MKFALVSGERQEAQRNLSGKCPACGHPMVAKCGEVRIRHWAHRGSRACDPWWENETEWHRDWKEQFPLHWQEFVQQAENGERHIADVKTDHGWVIEFQHSYLKPDERRSRNAFYGKLIWVVDGVRRKKDEDQFVNAWNGGGRVGEVVRRVSFPDECRLLQEWADSHGPVFVDFGDGVLWWLLRNPNGSVYLAKFTRAAFIDILRGGRTHMAHHYFDALVKEITEGVARYESNLLAQAKRAAQPRTGFQEYMARRNQRRRRF
jgi:hypothetical protein